MAPSWPEWTRNRRLLIAFGVFLFSATLIWFGAASGSHIILHRPAPADVILVLTDDPDDLNYWQALSLLRSGVGHLVLLDVDNTISPFGSTEIPLAQRFVAATAGDLFPKVHICSQPGLDEASYIGRCLKEYGIRTVLIVASEPHSREAYLRFRYCLPQDHWSVFAVPHPTLYGRRWWRHRQWAKLYLYSWEGLLDFALQSIRSSPPQSVCN